ncbi:aspartyl-phosphate phosphatase Spo0E family protein [Bacillaceae bacterium Marseille-Q3522]|nr:aspartyl-phosphate phosphatase Spo0E family protein [Bacillaceae bacterium Marseille-Q3522]
MNNEKGRLGGVRLFKDEERLIIEIQKKRKEMITCAEKNGFTSKETVYYSQELDQLIYQYQSTLQPRVIVKKRRSLMQWLINKTNSLVKI